MREAVGHTQRSSFVRPGLCWRWEETVNVPVNGPEQRTDDETPQKKGDSGSPGSTEVQKYLLLLP